MPVTMPSLDPIHGQRRSRTQKRCSRKRARKPVMPIYQRKLFGWQALECSRPWSNERWYPDQRCAAFRFHHRTVRCGSGPAIAHRNRSSNARARPRVAMLVDSATAAVARCIQVQAHALELQHSARLPASGAEAAEKICAGARRCSSVSSVPRECPGNCAGSAGFSAGGK